MTKKYICIFQLNMKIFAVLLLGLFVLNACVGADNSRNDATQSFNQITNTESAPYFNSAITNTNNIIAISGASGFILASNSGESWVFVKVPNSTNFMAITSGNKQFVTAGLGGQVFAIKQSDIINHPNSWTALRSAANMGNVRGVTYYPSTDELFFMVDDQGNIFYTRALDKGSFDHEIEPVTSLNIPLFAITTINLEGQNNFMVAVGANNTIVKSQNDGRSWAIQNNIAPKLHNSLYAVTSSESAIVAVGEHGTVVTSKDGNTWSENILPGYLEDTFTSVSYSNGKYVITPESGGYVLVSSNPLKANSWAKKITGNGNKIYSSTFFSGKLYYTGNGANIISGNESETFIKDKHHIPDADIRDVVSIGNKQFMLVGNKHSQPTDGYIGLYSYHENTGAWNLESLPISISPLKSGLFAQNQFVAVGESGQVVYGSPRNLSKYNLNINLNVINYLNGVYVIGGDNEDNNDNLLYSLNPHSSNNWSRGTIHPGFSNYIVGDVVALTNNGNNFIALAHSKDGSTSIPLLWSNVVEHPLGSWVPTIPLPRVNMNDVNRINDIQYGERGLLAIGGYGEIYYMDNHNNAYQIPIPVNQLTLYKTKYDYNSHTYIIVGESGIVATYNPISYEATHNQIPDTGDLHGIDYQYDSSGNEFAVIGGDNGAILHNGFGFSQVYPTQ